MKQIFLLMTLLYALQAQEYYVIAHNDVTELTSDQLKAVFLKKLQAQGGVHLVPINMPAKSELRNTFERDILHMNFQRLKSYWAKQHYQGHRPPLSMKSEAAVIRFVQKVSGSIAYVQTSPEKKFDNIKVIYKWSH